VTESRTLKGWRELAGYGPEEVAEHIGMDEREYRRWEEVGPPYVNSSRKGDEFIETYLLRASELLGPMDRVISPDAPREPDAGSLVISLPAKLDHDVMQYLKEHADELGLRVAVPNRFDKALKPYTELTDADRKSIEDEYGADQEHNEQRLTMLRDLGAMLGEHGASEADMVDEVFEERGGKLIPKRRDADSDEGEGTAGKERP
jgi:hypothetical protein